MSGGERSEGPGATGGEALQALYREARAQVPGVDVSLDEFAQHLLAHGPGPDAHAAELYLARGCMKGDAAALRLFGERYLARLGPALSRIDSSAAFLDEVVQRLRELLFVAPAGKAPHIAEYRGQGSLEGWVRVSATRIALRMLKQRKPEVAAQPGDERHLPDGIALSPELTHLKERYRPEFEAAYRDALRDLPAQPRQVLKLHYVDRLGIDRIGEQLSVHRATAARWIISARQQLLALTRLKLTERLRVPDQELDSLMHLVASQLDVSLNQLADSKPDLG